jgi:lipoprotein-anchoring transpeptidase ErfK/SrfK
MRSPGAKGTAIIATLAVVAVVVAVGVTVAVTRTGRHTAAAAPPATSVPTTTAQGIVADAPVVTSPPVPVAVTAVYPGTGTTDVATDAVLNVDYTTPLTSTPPLPTLNPPVAGTWTLSGSVLTFVPSGGWIPFTTETVTVPPGATAMVEGIKTTSITTTTTTFAVEAGNQTRLEQLLSELNFLPFTFTPPTPLPAGTTTALDLEPTKASEVSTTPLPGTLNWAYPNVPASLSSLWTPGQDNVLDKGAIMAFESQHDMTMDGIAGPAVWNALLTAVAARQVDTQPYDYLVASETLPETLTVWRNGQVIFTSPANTGVPGATTELGTFPVYSRFTSTTMTGTNADGSKYHDVGVPWVAYFNGGDAVHGFPRASYGFPQSNGCVELPIANAAQVFNMDPYGTLVSVVS